MVLAVVVVRGPGVEVALGRRVEAEQRRAIGRLACSLRTSAHARTQLGPDPGVDQPASRRVEQVGLVEHDQVGARELVLEQLGERALVVERAVGRALRPRAPPGRSAKRPSRTAGGIDHRDHPVDRDPGRGSPAS